MSESCSFKPSLVNVAAARRFAQRTALRWGIDSDALKTVVGELAKNAVLHGRSPFTVTLRIDGGHVRVEVADRRRSLPYIDNTDLISEGGRGLVIVEHASIRWGHQRALAGGKMVWAELSV
jgi:anti-sigma regulatory factor (Ser/Thr protein kinase)